MASALTKTKLRTASLRMNGEYHSSKKYSVSANFASFRVAVANRLTSIPTAPIFFGRTDVWQCSRLAKSRFQSWDDSGMFPTTHHGHSRLPRTRKKMKTVRNHRATPKAAIRPPQYSPLRAAIAPTMVLTISPRSSTNTSRKPWASPPQSRGWCNRSKKTTDQTRIVVSATRAVQAGVLSCSKNRSSIERRLVLAIICGIRRT